MYEPSFRCVVDKLLHQADGAAQEKPGGRINIPTAAVVKVVLSSPDIQLNDNVLTYCWDNSYLLFSFPVVFPLQFAKRNALFTATVYVNDFIATRLSFTVNYPSVSSRQVEVTRDDIFSAFISYVREDKEKVVRILQGMQKARPDLNLFFDVDSLRSGEDWEERLYSEIDKRDVLYLFWSHFAKASLWVDREWRYAFKNKGINGIEPAPLELPEKCPPPKELRKKHWSDKWLYYI